LYRPGVEGTGENPAAARAYEEALLKFNDTKAGWSYTAPTAPPTLFLDCRTRRGPREEMQFGRSVGALVDRDVWSHLFDLPGVAGASRRGLILILGTPFYNLNVMEEGQAILSHLPGGAERWDDETWASYPPSQRELLDFCLNTGAEYVTILSGDVHYASSAWSHVSRGRADSVLIRQFTSSSLKNGPGFGPALAARESRVSLTRRHSPPAGGADLILETISFETELVWPDPTVVVEGIVLRGVKCVIDTNVGLLTHHKDRVEHTLLVPRHISSPPDDAAEGLAYTRALTTNW
jgi:hypothetical protein